MKRSRRWMGWLAAGLAMTLLLSACGGGQRSGDAGGGSGAPAAGNAPGSAAGPRRGGVLKVATIGEPPTLDIHQTTAVIVEQVTMNVFEGLFALDKDYKPVPMLAESYQYSNDDKKLTVKLRQKVPFHNGKEMTSADVVPSIERWMRLASLGKQVGPKVESVKAVDPYTVEINLKEPLGMLIPALANPNNGAMIYPKEVIDEFQDQHIKTPIGTGPYRFVERLPDRHVRLARFDSYAARSEPPSGYAGKKEALVDEILFIPVPESGTRASGVETGEYHFGIQLPQDEYARLKDNPNLEMLIVKPYAWATAVFNKKKGLFTDVRLRQAFNAALSMEPIMKSAFGDAAFWRLDSSISPKETPWFGEFDNGVYNRRDVNKARDLLAKAGYKGDPVRWVTTKEYDFMYKAAVVAKQQLEEVGFKIDLQVVDWATLVQRRGNPDLYDVFSTGFVYAPEPTAQNVFLAPTWPGWYESPRMAEQLAIFARETDFARRKAAWDNVQKVFWEEIPAIKFGEYFLLNLKRKELKGFQNTPNVFFWNTWLER